jgi:hypothetical protein
MAEHKALSATKATKARRATRVRRVKRAKTGVPGVSGPEYVFGLSASSDSSALKSATASCRAGEKVIAGGAYPTAISSNGGPAL